MSEQQLRDLADRAALRQLSEAYAHGVDRREPREVADLFCEDGTLAIYEGDPDRVEPARVRVGRDEIATALEGLSRYSVTTHFIGQHTVGLGVGGDHDRATGETYCIAHHISEVDGRQHDHVLSIRYLDRYVRTGTEWQFEERRLVIDWTDERTLGEAQR